MCSMKTNTVLQAKNPMSLQKFNLKALIEEMQSVAPKTSSLLRSCLASRKRSKETNAKTKGRTKTRVFDCDNVVGVCCALLLRGRSLRMNLLQRLVSCVLYSGHSSKGVLCTYFFGFDYSKWLIIVVDYVYRDCVQILL